MPCTIPFAIPPTPDVTFALVGDFTDDVDVICDDCGEGLALNVSDAGGGGFGRADGRHFWRTLAVEVLASSTAQKKRSIVSKR